MEPPQDINQIRSCIGLFNFFRAFLPNYSHHAARLTALTRADHPYKKGPLPPEAMESFNALKRALLTCPSLNNPDTSKEFYLWTDASKGSVDKEGNQISGMIGWALTQLSNSGEHLPISFGSRLLQGHERNHTVPILERLAIIEG